MILSHIYFLLVEPSTDIPERVKISLNWHIQSDFLLLCLWISVPLENFSLIWRLPNMRKLCLSITFYPAHKAYRYSDFYEARPSLWFIFRIWIPG